MTLLEIITKYERIKENLPTTEIDTVVAILTDLRRVAKHMSEHVSRKDIEVKMLDSIDMALRHETPEDVLHLVQALLLLEEH